MKIITLAEAKQLNLTIEQKRAIADGNEKPLFIVHIKYERLGRRADFEAQGIYNDYCEQDIEDYIQAVIDDNCRKYLMSNEYDVDFDGETGIVKIDNGRFGSGKLWIEYCGKELK